MVSTTTRPQLKSSRGTTFGARDSSTNFKVAVIDSVQINHDDLPCADNERR
jgi:hypothetical protein